MPSPIPSDEEAVALVSSALVAILAAGAQSGGGGVDWATQDRLKGWRFSGRWWASPLPLSRPRP